MPGSKLNSVLCLILILNPFGTSAGLIDDLINVVDNSISYIQNCILQKEIPTLLPRGLLAHELLPRGEELWSLLRHTLNISNIQRKKDSRKMTQVILEDEYRLENHTITTEDGYMLTYYRIPCGSGNCDKNIRRPPVLIQHGFFTDSGSWIAVEKRDCLPYILADAGYDVWLGNARGTTPSRGHTNLSNWDPQYWDYEWEKMGTHDIPAAIEYILKNTTFPQLYYIGHSMGTTMAFAGLSLKPEVSDKIKVFFALAPVAWLHKSSTVLRLTAPVEVALQTASLRAFSRLMGQFISSISFKTLRHFLQNTIRNQFRRFDYGAFENMNKYGSCIPPEYNLTAIRSKTIFFYGDNDDFSRLGDVQKLVDKYNQTLLTLHALPHGWNHLDFLVARNAKKKIALPIINYMENNPIE